jgi:uncharacterized protein (DUF58 family)
MPAIPHPRRQAVLWLALLPLLTVLQIALPSKVWVILLVGMGGAWLLAFAWAKMLAAGLRLEREMRYGWANVGDLLEERFTLINTSLAPALWVEITDFSTLPGYSPGQVTAIAGDSRNSWKTNHPCTQRGLFTLGPTRVETGDPLGFFRVTFDLPGSAVLMVTPPVIPLPAIEVTPSGRAGEGRRSRRDPFERTVSVSGVSPYHPGDPLRWIHWPTSTRRQSLYVRNFESTPASDWWIFLDLQAGAQAGEGYSSTLEHGIILAASLADRGLRQGHAVGLSAAGRELIWLPPVNAAAQRMQILRQLALASSGEVTLAHLLESARPALQHGASLIFITPDPEGQWLEPLSMLLRGHNTPTVLLFDHASYGSPRSITSIHRALASLGVVPYIISKNMIDRPEARPGHQGEWTWRVTGFGRAIPIHKPADLSWKKLGT